jgi:hypothetical protein
MSVRKLARPSLVSTRSPQAQAAAVAGTRHEALLELDLARLTARDAQDLVIGRERAPLVLLGGDRHEVGDDQAARRRGEGRLEHVGVVDVAAARLARRRRRQDPASAVLVEQRAEERRRIEARPAQPVDGAEARHEGRGATVTDERVVGDARTIGHQP